MRAVWKGTYRQFSTSTSVAFYAGLRGQMYFIQAPQNTTTPYAVFDVVSHIHDWEFAADWENFEIQFTIIDDRNTSDIGKLYEDCNSMYDGITLDTTGYTCVNMDRDWSQLTYHTDEIAAKHIWQYTVSFNLTIKTT